MEEKEKIAIAQDWVRKLANGINPLNGNILAIHLHNHIAQAIIKSRPATAARIQPQPAINLLFEKLMGMAKNHPIYASQILWHIILVMNQEKFAVLYSKHQ